MQSLTPLTVLNEYIDVTNDNSEDTDSLNILFLGYPLLL